MNFTYWLLRRLFKYTSPLISIFEKSRINKYRGKTSKIPPIFIVGAPRTGSTILYQLITQYFDTIYFNNLVHLARENTYFGFWLSNKFFKGKPHNSFKSKHGDTITGGLQAPSEGGQIWQKWLPKYTDYLDIKIVSENQIEHIRKNISSIINKYDKPLIIKNNYNGLRLGLLKKIDPEAKIIFIKRDPLYTAQSIIKVRENIFNDRNKWWSVKPHNYKEFDKLSYIEQVIKQIYYIEKQINLGLETIDSNNVLIINYNDLAKQEDFVKLLQNFIGSFNLRKNMKFQEIRISQKLILEEEVIERLKKEIKKYDWENYTS